MNTRIQQTHSVRDRLWIWTHPAGSHAANFALPEGSRMTPVEGACYLGLDNLLFVKWYATGDPAADEFEKYAISFRPMRQVIWSIADAEGITPGDVTAESEAGRVIALAKRYPNIKGIILDDFFQDPAKGALAYYTPEQLRAIRSHLELPDRQLEVWVTLYMFQLYEEYRELLSLCDVLTLWTFRGKNLVDLEANLTRAEELAPTSRKLLGCYMYDYDYSSGEPMPLDLMQYQCETGLRWLREGRIDGMIFLASCICDQGLEAVEWTRQWIERVGDTPLVIR